MAAMKCLRGHLLEAAFKGMLRRKRRIHLHCRQAANERRQWHAACTACQKRKKEANPPPPSPASVQGGIQDKKIRTHTHWRKENIHTRAAVMPSCFVRAWHSKRPTHALRVAPGICQIPKPCLNTLGAGGFVPFRFFRLPYRVFSDIRCFECLVAL